jgi:hypothetical protein
MGLFGNKKPKLPSYSGVGLDALLQDPQWAYAIQQAGINPSSCEVVLRLSDATVGRGMGSVPEEAAPGILFGQGETLAMAYAGERDILVVTKNKSRGELQTQRSGWFQIVFGPASNIDGFMFWGHQDNLQLGTPEGENFGKFMSAFMRGQLAPGQVAGTPQSLVANGGGVSVEPPTPEFSDPEDALRWKLIFAVQGALAAMMDKYQETSEHAENVERAYGMANADVVNGVQQHPISKENFRKHAVQAEAQLPAHLNELREKTAAAASQWDDLMFLFPADDTTKRFSDIAQWCTANGLPMETFSEVIANGMFIRTDYGMTRESFWAENERVLAVMNRNGQ